MKRKITFLIAAFIALTLITQPVMVLGQAKPDPTYKLTAVTSVSAGNKYVFLQDNHVMINTVNSNKLQTIATSDQAYKTTGLTGTETYVWLLEGINNETNFYIQSATQSRAAEYINNPTKSNGDAQGNISLGNSASTKWKFSFTNGVAVIQNAMSNKNKDRFLGYMGVSTYEYKTYASSNLSNNTYPHDITVYVLEEESDDPAVTVTESFTSFNYVQGAGPSEAQSFTVSGINLGSNNITVSLDNDNNYEMSEQNGNNWSTITNGTKTLTPNNSGTVGETTLYVRLKAGLTGNNISGTITVSTAATGVDDQTINLSGSVTPTYTLTYSASNGNISGVLAGTQTTVTSGTAMVAGTTVTLTAEPSNGYKFNSWSDGGNNSTLSSTSTNPTTFTMGTVNSTVTATFTARTPATVKLHDGLNGVTETEVNTYTDATLANVIEGHDIASVNGWTALGWVKSYTSGTPTLITTSEAVGSTTDLYAVYKKGSNTFSRITSTNDLAVDGVYMICYNSSTTYKFMNDVSSNFMGYTDDNSVSNNSFEYVAGKKFTLGGSAGAYTLYDGSKYLTATSGQQYLGLASGGTNDVAKWTITFDNNSAKIKNNGLTGNNVYVSYYVSNNYFNMYTNYSTIYLFKQITNNLQYSTTPSAEKCHVTYDANGATSGNVPTDNGEYNPNDNVTVLSNMGTLARTGYTWSGWCLNDAGTGTVYGPTYTTTYQILANTTFYAKWNVQSYEYTLTDDAHSAAELKVGGETYSASTIPYGTEVEVYVETEDDNYLYFISVKDSEDNDVEVEDDTFTMPASDITITVTSRLKYKYELVTSTNQLVAGKHYVIATATSGTAYAMGYQRDSNRGKSAAVSFDNTGKLLEYYDIWDFVLSGDATNGWTLYDKYTEGEGFLCAASSSYNYLKLQTTLDANGKWAISFSSNKATIMAKGSYTRKYMRYNSSSNIFACYDSGTSQQDIYLFVKYNDDDYEIYSPTPMSGDQTVYSLVVEGTLTIKDGVTLEVLDELINDNPANLIIEDGGQLIASNSVAATVKKTIANAGAKDASEHWYTIASPVNDGTNNYIGINNTNTVNLTADSYDMFAYDEKAGMWLNQKEGSGANGFDKMYKGQGYLYRNSGNELSFVGNTNSGEVTYTLKKENTGDLAGFNLVGNPYPHDITLKHITYSTGDNLTGCYVLSDAGAWGSQLAENATISSYQGFLVQSDIDNKVATFHETAQRGAKSNGDNIKFIVANSQYEDVAYALFDKGFGLSKINHRNADIPMLYINQEDADYAIATMSDDTKSFNLNFKAMTTGKYTLSYKADGNFSYLHVIDRLTGEDVDMLLEGEYSFIASPIDSENRFIVRLEYSAGSEISESSIFAYQSGNDIIVNGEGELQIFDMMGRRVSTQYVSGVETINLQLNGVYIFRLNEKTQKIVVK